MGKLGKSVMPSPGSKHVRNANSSIAKAIFKAKRSSKQVHHISDPQLIPRVNQYLADHKDKIYVDINDMVDELQSRYKDYSRRKRAAFKPQVEKAFAVVLQQCGMAEQSNLGAADEQSSSSEVEECDLSDDNTANTSNNQLLNLYKPSQLQAMSKQHEKCPNDNAELIDLSSDDEEKSKTSNKEKKSDSRSNGQQLNHAFSNETSITIVPGSHIISKLREAPVISITRKRKVPFDDQKETKRKKERSGTGGVSFADFGGSPKVLEEVCKLIVHVQHPEIFHQIGISSPRGFLLHGPPGCGKTLLANAIAGELEVHLLKISAPELVAGVSGESEERIRELFHTAVESAPCVLFIDEIDAITPNRDNAQKPMEARIVAQLLSCLDELSQKPNGERVLVIGATNRPDSLDPALRRAGRFDREVCLGIPDAKAREDILKVLCSKLRLTPDFSFSEVAQNTPGYVGADLLSLAREAAMAAVNRAFSFLHQKSRTKRLRKQIYNDVKHSEIEIIPNLVPMKPPTDDPVTVVDDSMDIEITEERPKEAATTTSTTTTTVDDGIEVVIADEKSKEKEIEKETKEPESDKSEKEIVAEVVKENKVVDGEEKAPEEEKKTPEAEKKTPEEEKKTPEDEKKAPENDVQINDKVEENNDKEEKGKEPEKEKEAEKIEDDKMDEDKNEDEVLDISEKEKETTKNESDMDTSETDNLSSGTSDIKDVEEINKDGRDQSQSESDVEAIPIRVGPPSLETLLSWVRDAPPLSPLQLRSLCITQEDFKNALKSVQPSAKREGFATVPDVTWDDIGSLSDIREELKMSILAPVKFPKQFEQLGLTTSAGVLLCGPPGCGKTLLAKAVANEAGINFISVKGPELLNMYVGESERAVRQCFQRAKNSKPCVIFFDELDALCPKRTDSGPSGGVASRVVNQMLTEMDGVESRQEVFLMAATNRPDIIDPAVLRPGRFDKVLFVGLPDENGRLDILKAITKNSTRPKLADDVCLEELARAPECQRFTGADLAALVREAGVLAIKELFSCSELNSETDVVVDKQHFDRALNSIRPSVSLADQRKYEELRKEYTTVLN